MRPIHYRVVAHDPTIDGSTKPASDLISFRRLGIADVTANATAVGPVMTLKVLKFEFIH